MYTFIHYELGWDTSEGNVMKSWLFPVISHLLGLALNGFGTILGKHAHDYTI